MSEYFEGRYFKHQKDGEIIALIPGRCEDAAFVQVLDRNQSFCFFYPVTEYENTGGAIRVGPNIFSVDGIHVDINRDGSKISAELQYGPFTPIRSDIMGPFRFFPMQCRHGIISMRHNVNGLIQINDRAEDFTGGVGYIEEDSGCSFPSEYLWIQCNENDYSIMLSVADIPFCGLRFTGCVCAILHQSREYRLATYRGVKIERREPAGVILRQGIYRLEVEIDSCASQPLFAPHKGKMSRTIKECVSCCAVFTFFEREHALFRLRSSHASFEYMCPN